MSGGQPKPQSARDRLALISHYFLSNDEGSDGEGQQPAPDNDVYSFALLSTANNGDELPIFELCQLLAIYGQSSAMFNTTADKRIISFSSQIDSQPVVTVHHGLSHNALEDIARRFNDNPHDAYFFLVDTPESPRLSSVNTVLVSVPATTGGVQSTYLSIKQLVAHHNAIQVGVIITGVSDANLAERTYNRLAKAVHHFLDRDLLSYGYLPAYGSTGQMTAPRCSSMFLTSTELSTIAKIISDECYEWKHRKTRAFVSDNSNCAFRGGNIALSGEEAVYFNN